MDEDAERRKGLIATAAAFLFWGVVPVYWKAVGAVPPAEMLGWRVVFGLPFAALFLVRFRGVPEVLGALRRPRLLGLLALSAALVAVNWFIFIHAIAAERVMETSLGYYINPLVNVLLGFVFLRERPRPLQWTAIALAALGVGLLVAAAGALPWVALALALTFGLYGLVRKLAPINALPGLFLEVLLLTPLAALWLVWLTRDAGMPAFAHVDALTRWLVPVSGLVTVLPLVWFAYGARRLPLATVGILQFLAPTGQFLLATLVYRETFTPAHAVTFALIWAGVGLYLVDLQRAARRRRRAAR